MSQILYMRKIKDIQKIERPREKLERYGPDKLLDAELLAILIGSGTKGKNVVSLSKEVLKRVKRIGVSSVSADDLYDIRGLGKVKCQQVVALLELAKRLYEESRKEILSNKDVWNMCADFYRSKQEHLAVFYLDTRSCLIERKIIFIGTLNESVAHPRDIFEPALKLNAATVVIAHNHPSGNPDPSDADIYFTRTLIEAGKVLGIRVQDHLIVTPKNYFSMREGEESLNF